MGIILLIMDTLLFQFQSKFEAISSTPTPDGNLNYNDLLDATEKVCLHYSSVCGRTFLFMSVANCYCSVKQIARHFF